MGDERAKPFVLKDEFHNVVLHIYLFFSPVNRDGGGGMPNLNIFDVETGEIKKSYIQKKQINW